MAKFATVELTKDELWLINDVLVKTSAQSETEGFQEEKRIIDSFRDDDNKTIQLF